MNMYENSILKYYEQNEDRIDKLFSFQIASIYRENIDVYVPNELPIYLYVEKEKSLN